ncbi:MAG TPA: hypothetical protein VIN40_01715 [Candidatus Tyrphobacter sp.]
MSKGLALLSLSLLLASGAASAAVPPQMASLQFMVGTWNCTTTAGPTTIAEAETIVAQNPLWLHGSGTITSTGQPVSEDFYVGYDARRSQWVLITIDSNGEYGIATSVTPNLSPSTWISAYPAMSGMTGTGTFTKVSDRQYTVDFSQTVNNKVIGSHEVCTKQ